MKTRPTTVGSLICEYFYLFWCLQFCLYNCIVRTFELNLSSVKHSFYHFSNIEFLFSGQDMMVEY